jgi:phosphohistidine phosphatase
MRHGHAEEQSTTGRDFDRALSAQGKQETLVRATKMVAEHLAPQLILASSARRTRETALLIATEVGLPSSALRFDLALYNATARALQAAILAERHEPHILLIAHNPGVSELARLLSGNGDLPYLATAELLTLTLSSSA